MTKHKLYIKIKPQILKDIVHALVSCKATFEVNVCQSSLYILDVSAFNFDTEKSESMYRIQIDTENNTKDIFIASGNMEEFTVHFQ